MAAFMEARITGGPELAAALRALPASVRPDVMLKGVTEAAEPIRVRMGQLAPRGPDAPHLADSMAVSRIRSFQGVRVQDDTEVAVAIGPTKDFFYGLFWEYGWKFHRAAYPFARPAFDAGRDEAIDAVGRAYWAGIQNATGASA
jgi:hypothetical protein